MAPTFNKISRVDLEELDQREYEIKENVFDKLKLWKMNKDIEELEDKNIREVREAEYIDSYENNLTKLTRDINSLENFESLMEEYDFSKGVSDMEDYIIEDIFNSIHRLITDVTSRKGIVQEALKNVPVISIVNNLTYKYDDKIQLYTELLGYIAGMDSLTKDSFYSMPDNFQRMFKYLVKANDGSTESLEKGNDILISYEDGKAIVNKIRSLINDIITNTNEKKKKLDLVEDFLYNY